MGFPEAGCPHEGSQAGAGSQDPSHCPSQEQAPRGTRAAPALGIGHLRGNGDGLRVDGTAGSVSNLVEFNCNIGNSAKQLNVWTVFYIIIIIIIKY